MDKQKLIHTFCIYSGLTAEQAVTYDNLFELAISEVMLMLKANIDLVEYDTYIHYLAGVFAYYRYVLLFQATSTDEIKLSDLCVKTNRTNAIDLATKIRNDAICLCRELLEDSFYFSCTTA